MVDLWGILWDNEAHLKDFRVYFIMGEVVMKKIVINRCTGGFGVSSEVCKELGITLGGYICNEDLAIESSNEEAYRADSRLIAAIEKLGLMASSRSWSKLAIVEIPEDVDWEIEEYDDGGMERVREVSRCWGDV